MGRGTDMTKEVEFGFVVSRNDDGDISEEQMNRLLDKIIDVVESEGMGMGGGCMPLKDEEDTDEALEELGDMIEKQDGPIGSIQRAFGGSDKR
jgi:hypothetical protein